MESAGAAKTIPDTLNAPDGAQMRRRYTARNLRPGPLEGDPCGTTLRRAEFI